MHRIWLLAIALMLAGCTTQNDEVAAPEETGLPSSSNPPPSSDPGNGGTQPGQGVAPQQGFQENSTKDLLFSGTMKACEEGFCLATTASNEGSTTYHVSNICTSPFAERMEQEGKSMSHKEPMFTCMAFGTKEFTPGETLDFATTWNGTLWNDDRQSYEAAPQGAYQWIASFQAFGGSDGEDPVRLELSFTVVIGET